jgi:hypothetical protein
MPRFGPLFQGVNALLRRGFGSPLRAPDLLPLPQDCCSDALHAVAQQRLSDGGTVRRGWLLRLLLAVVWRELALALVLATIYAATQVANPVLIREVVRSVGAGDRVALGAAAGLLVSGVIAAVCNQYSLYLALLCGQRMRALTVALVYRKALSQTLAQ